MTRGGESVRPWPAGAIAAMALGLAGAAGAGLGLRGEQPGPGTASAPASAESQDAALRAAWEDPSRRVEAARALWALHERPDFRLPVDAAGLESTRRLLGERFLTLETPHFVVLSDCGAGWTRRMSRVLERARHQFYRVADRLGLDALPHREKLLCILFSDAAEYRSFARAQDGMSAAWAAGYYSTRANRVVFYNDESSAGHAEARSALEGYAARARQWRAEAAAAMERGDAARAEKLGAAAAELEDGIERERERLNERVAAATCAKTIHEAVHLLAYNSGVQSRSVEYPFWISEGLAASFETDDPGGAFGPDRDRPGLAGELRQAWEAGTVGSVGALVGAARVARDRPQMTAEGAGAMYTQSEALVRHLFRFERESLAAYLKALRDSGGPVDHEEQFRRHFGDPAEVERRLMRP